MVKLMSVMSGLIGWTLSLGVGALIILAIAAALLVKAGKLYFLNEKSPSFNNWDCAFPSILLWAGIIFLLVSLWISSRWMAGFVAKDIFSSKPLSNYGIYETIAWKWIGPDKYVVILKDQTNRLLAYEMGNIPPKAFKAIPVKKKGQKREYQPYQVIIQKVTPKITDSTQVETGRQGQELEEQKEIPEMDEQ
ncbi:hypothetical protein COS59_00070 [Candidatus Wolfebacteria bacterium CG03_land_8_20_14_0_80_36_15]|uniref:Uncharacterized protein n=1 Tax=Candidatus Wolfebacteria bacterium CG03_land_8_20_14_0_80_36_15 TaxID=1975067 RepID=A0A2M7B8D3_9BACT|nr:MAG: hypothetical protein COS59_00070 [Candidatus Wolfebacteria bacterium CG03_land_8_20_14_0_80_36_15]